MTQESKEDHPTETRAVQSSSKEWTELLNNCHRQWWRDPGLRSLNLRLIILFLCPLILGYDGSLIGGLLAIPRWYSDLGTSPEESGLIGIMTAGISLGGVATFVCIPYLAARLSQRQMIILGDIIVVVVVIGQTFCFNARLYILTRFLIGGGCLILVCSSPVLVTDLAHPRNRGFLMVAYSSFFYVGSLLSAWVVFGSLRFENSWSWRFPTLFQAVAPALQLCLMVFVPDSPRWLASRGKYDTSLAVLAKYHANGDTEDHLVVFECQQIRERLEAHVVSTQVPSVKAPWLEFLRTPAKRRVLLVVILVAIYAQWSGNGIVSIYFSYALRAVGVNDPSRQMSINGGLQAFNIVTTALITTVVDRLGRRPLFLTSSIVMLSAMVGLTAASATRSWVVIIVMFFISQLGYNVGYAALGIAYTAEVCPSQLRTHGMALHYLLALGGGAISQFVNPIGLERLGWKFYFVYLAILATSVVATWLFYPETKGHTVEDIAKLFETWPYKGGARIWKRFSKERA